MRMMVANYGVFYTGFLSYKQIKNGKDQEGMDIFCQPPYLLMFLYDQNEILSMITNPNAYEIFDSTLTFRRSRLCRLNCSGFYTNFSFFYIEAPTHSKFKTIIQGA